MLASKHEVNTNYCNRYNMCDSIEVKKSNSTVAVNADRVTSPTQEPTDTKGCSK